MERDEKGRFKSKVTATGYKGFDQSFKCRNKQYSIGEVFRSKKALLCKTGLHFCKRSLDVFEYYPPSNSRYAEVEALSDVYTTGVQKDTKSVTTRLRIVKELSVSELLSRFLDDIEDRVVYTSSKLSYQSISCMRLALTQQEFGGAVSLDHLALAGAIRSNSGVVTTAGRSIAAATGSASAAHTCSEYSVAASTGDSSAVIVDDAFSAAVSTAPLSLAEAHGKGSVALVTHPHASASACTPNAVAMCTSYGGYVRGVKGSFLIASNEDTTSYSCVKVDGKKIKENTWYIYENNQWVPYDKIQ